MGTPVSGGEPVVEAAGLCRRFGRRWAFARVDLSLAAGERLLILGANGSGKTTLLRVLATALSPSRGDLRLFGKDPVARASVVRPRLALLGHQIGAYEDLSGADNLAVLARLLGVSSPDVPGLLDRVGLDQRIEPIRTYSAGMRKRLQLAALLLKGPDLALLDEPFAALDPEGCAHVAALIREMPGTVIIASHQIRRAADLCGRAMLMDKGQVRWTGEAGRAWEAWEALMAQAVAP